MNQVISWLRNIRISQILVVFLIGFMFLLGQAFSYVNVAQAETVKTPEGIYYKGTPDEGEIKNDTQIRNAPNPLTEVADKIREKLNLDEETPRATKEFFDPERNITGDNARSFDRDEDRNIAE